MLALPKELLVGNSQSLDHTVTTVNFITNQASDLDCSQVTSLLCKPGSLFL